jgi:flagellar hook assembly protein FlgD
VELASFTHGRPRILSIDPNPTAGPSRIRFLLDAPAETRCDLYDLRGTLVRRLLSGSLPAGLHEIPWDGRDGRGRVVSSGLYLLKLAAGKEKLEGKVLRLR